jgi:hypothetical protein
MKPNYEGVIWNVRFRTNRYGLRDEEDFPREVPPEEIRIMSMGDSIAFGLGVEASEHYSKILQRNLNATSRTHHFRVINAAGPGFSPTGYYLYLKHEGLELGPELVVIEIELCNDVTDEALLRWDVDSEEPGVPVKAYGGRYVVGWDGNLLATYATGWNPLEHTYTYTHLTRRFLNLLLKFSPPKPFDGKSPVTYYSLGFDRFLLNQERIESGWQRVFGALAATEKLLRSRGVDFLLVIMPTKYMFETGTGGYRTFATDLVDRAVREAEDRRLPFIELTTALAEGGGESLYLDFAHPSTEGNRVIGEELTQQLASWVSRKYLESESGVDE